MKRSPPHKPSLPGRLHPKQRVRQACEVVVVDARVHERGRQRQRPDVVLHGELARPHGQSPIGGIGGEGGMVGHAAVDVMRYTRLFGGVCAGFADGHLVAPMHRVDEGDVGAVEERGEQGVPDVGRAGQVALEEPHVGERGELVGHEPLMSADLRTDVPADGAGGANE